MCSRFGGDVDVRTEVIEADDVADAPVDEADEHDLAIIGSSRDSVLHRVVFGGIPEAVGDRARTTAIMVRRNLSAGSRIRRILS